LCGPLTPSFFSACSDEKRYEYHLAAPIENTELMNHVMTACQNNSLRMNNVSGAMIVAQMDELSDRVDHWNAMGEVIMKGLEPVSDLIIVPKGEKGAGECFDHCVFSTPSFNQEQRDFFTKECKVLGVDVKPFGTVENARFFKNWKFLNDIPDMPQTEDIVRHAFDMKVPFSFTASDWEHISAIMCEVARKTDALN
jgi:dTDP-4-amino-4,6-dideoxygalactose transaminase